MTEFKRCPHCGNDDVIQANMPSEWQCFVCRKTFPKGASILELQNALHDMIQVAEFAGWDKATTGRDLVLKHAKQVLKKSKEG